MTIVANTHRRPFVRGKQRASTWLGPADQGFVGVGANLSVIQQSFSFEEDFTIARTRGILSIGLAAHTADVDAVGAMGIAIVSDQAFAAGAGSIPGPWTDANWDGWFVWQPIAYHFEFVTGAGFDVISQQYEVDSKAMRKVTANETAVVMVESQAAAFEAAFAFRMLVKFV